MLKHFQQIKLVLWKRSHKVVRTNAGRLAGATVVKARGRNLVSVVTGRGREISSSGGDRSGS